MGHHRAKRGLRRSTSETPRSRTSRTPGRRVAVGETTPFELHDATTEILPVVTLDDTDAIPLPDLRSAPSVAGKRAAPGKRRAAKPTRGPLVRGVPSAPVLLGTAALTLAIGGAVVTTSDSQLTSATDGVEQVTARGGSTGEAAVGGVAGRNRPISRDSSRDALEETADTKLVKAAEKQTKQRNAALGRLAQAAEAQAAELAKNKWVAPLSPVSLTARFGEYGLWASYHTGLDFNGTTGQPIQAIASGVVTFVGYDGSYGNKTVVTLEDGTELWYAHQNEFGVSEGDTVTVGDVIGYVGSTGNSTGSHLHVEVRPGGGDPVDPYPALLIHGVPLG